MGDIMMPPPPPMGSPGMQRVKSHTLPAGYVPQGYQGQGGEGPHLERRASVNSLHEEAQQMGVQPQEIAAQ
jgi:hypothetical protein